MRKISVYQLFLRVFGNTNTTNQFYGTLAENGSGKFSDLNERALAALRNFGITHVWYTGIIEHATLTDFREHGIKADHPQVVKGIAGSPYAIKDYYDVNAYLADNVEQRMAEFEALLARTHQAGLKALIDFVPNHVARQYRSDVKPAGVKDFGEEDDPTIAFLPHNNFYYLPNQAFVVPQGVQPPISFAEEYREYPARSTGNDVFSASPGITDWYETVKLNYGIDYLNHRSKHFDPIPRTWYQMEHILLFWAGKGVDGFRCDMAEMVPVEFWHWVIPRVKANCPGVVFIAEIYSPHLYESYLDYGHFDFLYDKVGLYDALRRLIEGHGNAMDITKVWQTESGAFSDRMLRFLENHDEQRIASHYFGKEPSAAFAAMVLSATMHRGPLMLYGGQEFGVCADVAEGFQGNDGRTTIFDFWAMPEHQAWLKNYAWEDLEEQPREAYRFYQWLLHFVRDNEAVYAGEFHDLQYLNGFGQSRGYDERKIYAYLRFTGQQQLLFVFNFGASTSFDCKVPKSLLGGRSAFRHVGGSGKDVKAEDAALLQVSLALPGNAFGVWESYHSSESMASDIQ